MTKRIRPLVPKILSVFLAILMLAYALPTAEAQAASTKLSNYENAVMFWINVERSRRGLSKLKTTDKLVNAADSRANELTRKFSHTRPSGYDFDDVLQAWGVKYNAVGENIAKYNSSPSYVVKKWMESSGHRANILDTDYSYIGVGAKYKDADSKYYVDAMFAGGKTNTGAYLTYNVAPTALLVSATNVKVSVGKSTTVTGYPQPTYATSIVSCTSSNSSVVKVTGTEVNVITIKGVKKGTAKLTLKCGDCTRIINVTVS